MSSAPGHDTLDPPVGSRVGKVGPRPVLTAGVHAARTIVWGASATVLVLALGSLIWGGGSGDLLPPGVGMRPGPACVVVLLALALVCLGSGGRSGRLLRWGRRLAVAAVAAALFALLLHAGVARRVAGAIAPDLLVRVDSVPTVPVAAGGLLGLALLCLHRGSRGAARLMVLLALVSGFVGLLGVFGHVFDAPRLYFGSGIAAVAPMGTVSLLLLSMGVWCAQPDRGPVGLLIADDAGGASLRHLLPAVLVLLPVLAYARVSLERAGWVGVGAGAALFVALVMVVLGGLLAIDARRLSRLDRRNRQAALSLAALAADLERQVTARTHELSHSNAELRQEVTERQRADELFRVVFADAPNAAVIVDPDGLILMANAQAEALFGYTAPELLGQPVEMLVPVDLQEGHRRYRQGYMADPRHRPMGAGQVLSGRCKDGGRPILEISLSPAQLSDRQVFIAAIQDVTERKQAEQRILELNQALARRADELEAANHELEAFSYSVSHDLRAPLRSIDGFSRIIEQQCADRLDEANRERLGRVRHNAQRMGTLIDDLLNLARLTRTPLRWGPVDLSAMATQIVDALRERDPQREVEVTIAPGLQAWGDGALLRVALDNLLDNAWKFTRDAPAARIEFGLEPAAAESVFVVCDNGAGFDMAHAEQLFGPFQRLHGMDEFPGTGIGLATVQRIIHKHGGRIWAQAQPRQGACFRFTLPHEAPT